MAEIESGLEAAGPSGSNVPPGIGSLDPRAVNLDEGFDTLRKKGLAGFYQPSELCSTQRSDWHTLLLKRSYDPTEINFFDFTLDNGAIDRGNIELQLSVKVLGGATAATALNAVARNRYGKAATTALVGVAVGTVATPYSFTESTLFDSSVDATKIAPNYVMVNPTALIENIYVKVNNSKSSNYLYSRYNHLANYVQDQSLYGNQTVYDFPRQSWGVTQDHTVNKSYRDNMVKYPLDSTGSFTVKLYLKDKFFFNPGSLFVNGNFSLGIKLVTPANSWRAFSVSPIASLPANPVLPKVTFEGMKIRYRAFKQTESIVSLYTSLATVLGTTARAVCRIEKYTKPELTDSTLTIEIKGSKTMPIGFKLRAVSKTAQTTWQKLSKPYWITHDVVDKWQISWKYNSNKYFINENDNLLDLSDKDDPAYLKTYESYKMMINENLVERNSWVQSEEFFQTYLKSPHVKFSTTPNSQYNIDPAPETIYIYCRAVEAQTNLSLECFVYYLDTILEAPGLSFVQETEGVTRPANAKLTFGEAALSASVAQADAGPA